jgi:hypothetical protein
LEISDIPYNDQILSPGPKSPPQKSLARDIENLVRVLFLMMSPRRLSRNADSGSDRPPGIFLKVADKRPDVMMAMIIGIDGSPYASSLFV